MTTFRKIAVATALVAGLLAAGSALANDVSSDRHFKAAPPARAAATAPAQEARAEPAPAAKDAMVAAHGCGCAHRS